MPIARITPRAIPLGIPTNPSTLLESLPAVGSRRKDGLSGIDDVVVLVGLDGLVAGEIGAGVADYVGVGGPAGEEQAKGEKEEGDSVVGEHGWLWVGEWV